MSLFRSYERSAYWLSVWKKKMSKTNLVRELIEVGKDNFGSHWRVSHSHLHHRFWVARSSLLYQSRMHIRDAQEKEKLEQVHEEHPWYGQKRVAIALDWWIKKASRLMNKFHIRALVPKKNRWIKPNDQWQPDMHDEEWATTKTEWENWWPHGAKQKPIIGPNGLPITTKIKNYLKSLLSPIAPNVVWRSDFTHIIHGWVHLYLATVLDDYTKEIVGYSLSYNHTQVFIQAAIDDALKKRWGIVPHIFHSDQWSEYTSDATLSFLRWLGILVSMSNKWSPWQNGAQESYYWKLKLELWNTKQYQTKEELILALHRCIAYYNTKRIHTTIKMTPVQFYEKWNNTQRIITEQQSNRATTDNLEIYSISIINT